MAQNALERIFFLSGATIGVGGIRSNFGVIFSLNTDTSSISLIMFSVLTLNQQTFQQLLNSKIRPLDMAIAVFGSMLVSL